MFYLLLFLLICLFTIFELINIEYKYQTYMTLFIVLIFVLVAGLRYETGVDWLVYEKMLETTPPITDITDDFGRVLIFSTPDYGYCLLMSIVKYFGGSIQVIFFITSCASMFFIYKGVNCYSESRIVSLLIYFSLFFFILDMSGLRQGFSLSVFFYSIKYIHQRKFWIYLAIILFAASFHWSAYLLIPVYFIAKRRFSSTSLIVFFCISLIIFFFNISWLEKTITAIFPSLESEVFAAKLLVYTTNDKFAEGRQLTANTIASILFYITTFAFCIFYRDRLEERNKYFYLFFNIYICQIFAFFCLYELIEMADRLRLYFLISNVVLFPSMIYLFQVKKERILAFTYAGVFAFFSCMPYILNAPTTIAYYPYQNYVIYKMFNIESTGPQRLQKHSELHE